MPPEIGSRRNVPRKLIDSWTYKVKDVEIEKEEYIPEEDREDAEDEKYRKIKQRIRNRHVTVQIYMERETRQSEEPPHPIDKVWFEAHCAELDLKFTGTDLELLRQTMWSNLDKKFEIKWEYYFLVEIEERRPYSGSGTGMEFSYKDMQKGTTWDGKNLMKIYRGGSYGNGTKIEPWPGRFTNKNGKVLACIPDNEENKRALKEFCARMDKLREALAEFLTPEKIQGMLANMAGLALLPAITEGERVTEDEPLPPNDQAAIDV